MTRPQEGKDNKDLHKLYKNHGLKIAIASSGPVANYLDATMDLSDGSVKRIDYKRRSNGYQTISFLYL